MADKSLPLQRTALIELTFSVIDSIRRARYLNEKTAIKLPSAGHFSSGEIVVTDTEKQTFSGITQFVLVYAYQEFKYDITIGGETIHGATCSGTLCLTSAIDSITVYSKTTDGVRIEYAYS